MARAARTFDFHGFNGGAHQAHVRGLRGSGVSSDVHTTRNFKTRAEVLDFAIDWMEKHPPLSEDASVEIRDKNGHRIGWYVPSGVVWTPVTDPRTPAQIRKGAKLARSVTEKLPGDGLYRVFGFAEGEFPRVLMGAWKSESTAASRREKWMDSTAHRRLGDGSFVIVKYPSGDVARWAAVDGLWVAQRENPRSIMAQQRKPNPRGRAADPKVPILRRREALALAKQVATEGWEHHKANARHAEYWSKPTASGGEINLTHARGITGRAKFVAELITADGHVLKLGTNRGTIDDAKVYAVLESMKRGTAVVNPSRIRSQTWMSDAVRHPGRLAKLAKSLGFEDKPFMKRPLAQQKQIVDACVSEYGYRSCLGSVMMLGNFPAIRDDPRMASRAQQLKRYVMKRHGGARGLKRNPVNGEWEAVPAILMHIDIQRVTLTRVQLAELAEETS